MEDNDATARQFLIPPFLLAVFHDIVFVFKTVITDEICLRLVTKSRNAGLRSGTGQFCRLEPLHEPALMGRVACRTVAASVIVSIVHQIPSTDIFRRTIEIWESEAMAVLMTDGSEGSRSDTDFLHSTVTIDQIVFAAIGYLNRIAIDTRLAVLQMLTHPPLMRPYAIAATTIVHALTGIDNEQLVDIAVAVPVVQTPVNGTCLEHFHDILYQILRILVIGIGTLVLLHLSTDLHILQVKRQIESRIALGIEIVMYGTLIRCLRIIHRIEDLIPLFHRSRLITLKRTVGKSHQHQQLTTVALVEVTTWLTGGFRGTPGRCLSTWCSAPTVPQADFVLRNRRHKERQQEQEQQTTFTSHDAVFVYKSFRQHS